MERATHVAKHAATAGTLLHDLCEQYLLNNDINHRLKDPFIYKRFSSFKPILDRISNIKALEIPLYNTRLRIAGTVDCIAEFDGVLSVIDFKTSKRVKSFEDIPHYFAQCLAYALMVKQMYGVVIEDIVILISVDDDFPIVFKSKTKDHLGYLVETIKMYRAKYERT